MNNVIARMYDFFDYLFNQNVIKTEFQEQGEYEKEQMKISDLKSQLKQQKEKYEKEIGIVTLSRDRYLENCKKKKAEIKELKKEIRDLKNGKGSV